MGKRWLTPTRAQHAVLSRLAAGLSPWVQKAPGGPEKHRPNATATLRALEIRGWTKRVAPGIRVWEITPDGIRALEGS